MTKGVVALYDDLADAQRAILELVNSGFDRNKISLISHRVAAAGEQPAQVAATESNMLEGPTAGAITGGVAGLLAGLAALAIPGIGPVLAAGPFLAFFGGAAGSIAGSFIGAFADWGLRENEAENYTEGLRRGGTLVAVEADAASAPLASQILQAHHAVDINRRAAQWRESGWKGLDPNAKPYTAEEITEERGRYQASKHDEETLSGALGVNDQSLRAGKLPGMISMEDAEAAFEEHYRRTYASTGRDYAYYHAAYRFGYGLANDERYADKEWAMIEPELRHYWGEFNDPASWDDFKKAVQFARDAARGRT